MDWFTAAVISALGLSAQALMFQRLQRHYPINTFMTYAWLGATVALALLFLRPEHLEAIARNWLALVLCGITQHDRQLCLQPRHPPAKQYRLCRGGHVLAADDYFRLFDSAAQRAL